MKKSILPIVACVGLMSFMTACGNQNAQAVTGRATPSNSEVAEVLEEDSSLVDPETLTGLHSLDDVFIDGDAYAYVTLNDIEVCLHALEVEKDDAGKVYGKSAEVIGVNKENHPQIFGFVEASIDGNYLATDGTYIYSYNDTSNTKFTCKPETGFTMAESAYMESDPETKEVQYVYLASKTADEVRSTDDTKFNELNEALKSLSPIEFTVVGDGEASYRELFVDKNLEEYVEMSNAAEEEIIEEFPTELSSEELVMEEVTASSSDLESAPEASISEKQ